MENELKSAEPTQAQLDAFIERAGFSYGWRNLESWARRMAEQAVSELNSVSPSEPPSPTAQSQAGDLVTGLPVDPSDFYGVADAIAAAIRYIELDEDPDAKVLRRLRMAYTAATSAPKSATSSDCGELPGGEGGARKLVEKLLDDHQRMDPHHEHLCDLCKEAKAFLDAPAKSPNRRPNPADGAPMPPGYRPFA